MKIIQTILVVILAAWAMPAALADAHDELTATPGSSGDLIRVPIYKSRVLTLQRPARRVSVGSPDIADILILRSRQLYVLGKDIGTTNVLLWDERDELIRAIDVEVTHDLDGLKSLLHKLLPDEQIEVRSALRSLVLSGQVSTTHKMQSALEIANSFLQQIATAKSKDMFDQAPAGGEEKIAGEVINMMTIAGNHQVMLEVKVAELSRSVLKRWDLNFNGYDASSRRWTLGGVNGGASFPDAEFAPDDLRIPLFGDGSGSRPTIGPVIDEFLPNDMSISNAGLFASFISDQFVMNMALDAARENGLAKILAEPTLTTQSGKEAVFLSGGEFPIPVPQGLDTITITFKEFGVGLRFLPVVVDTDQINLELSVTVSDLVSPDAVTLQPAATSTAFFVPALSKRSASTTVELRDGQTIGIAGLINEDVREIVNKFPGLGNLPVLGHLFRSQEFVKGETELVILVTPHLARPLPPGRIDLPTDQFVEPTDVEFYLMGRMQGRGDKATSSARAAAPTPPAATEERGTEGAYGHSID